MKTGNSKDKGLKEIHNKIMYVQNDIKSLRDTLEIEKEAWMNNYKKQQSTKFMEREAELHHQYKRERDKDIEMVIEKLESEASQVYKR